MSSQIQQAVPTTTTRPWQGNTRFTVMLGLVTALGPLTINLYLPAFPRVASDLSASNAQIQLTLAATTIGLSIGQLLNGPLSDRVGRRLPLLAGLVLYVGCAIAAAFAPTVEALTVIRFGMGAAAAAGTVIALTMVRDRFDGPRMLSLLALLGAVNGFAPIAAPVIGSQLLPLTGWRGLFLALAGFAALVTVLVLVSGRETLDAAHRTRGRGSLAAGLGALRADQTYLGLVLVGGGIWGAEFAYLSSSSFIFQERFELSVSQYGYLVATNAVGFVLGNQAGAHIGRRTGRPHLVLLVTTLTMVACGATVVALTLAIAPWAAVAVCLWLFVSSVGASLAPVQVLALERHGSRAGLAASVLGASSFAIAGALTALPGLFADTMLGMGIVMTCASGVAAGAMVGLVRPSLERTHRIVGGTHAHSERRTGATEKRTGG